MRMTETTANRLHFLRGHLISIEQIILEAPEEVFTKKPYVNHMILPDKAMQRLDALAEETKLSKTVLFERAIDYCYAQNVQTEEKLKHSMWRKSLVSAKTAKGKAKPQKRSK